VPQAHAPLTFEERLLLSTPKGAAVDERAHASLLAVFKIHDLLEAQAGGNKHTRHGQCSGR
jgi:hypothetical protein